MATERKKLTKGIVAAAVAQVGKRELTLSDPEARGLSLRVRKTSAIWCLRARLGPKQTTWRVGDARVMKDPQLARDSVHEAWSLIRKGVDPEEKLRELENGGPTERHFDEARDGWMWKDARERYLAHVERTLAEATHKDYRICLRSADFKEFEKKLVRQITAEDAKRIRNAIYGRNAPWQSKHALAILQACMGWLAEQPDSGIDASAVAGVKALPVGRNRPTRVHLPTEAELGELPWRLEAAGIPERSLLAGLLLLLTAQRIRTVVSAGRADFEEVEAGMVWAIPAERMKANTFHVVPLPPATAAVVRQALALPSTSPFLFPQVRPRLKGGRADGHISYHPIAEPLDPLDPHDFRHAFVTYGESRLGLGEGDLAAILQHSEGRRLITTKRYGRRHMREIQVRPLRDPQHPKWVTMRKWEDWVLDLALRHRPAPEARLRTLLLPEGAGPPLATVARPSVTAAL